MSPIEAAAAKRIRLRCHERKERFYVFADAVKVLLKQRVSRQPIAHIFRCPLGERVHWHIGRDVHPTKQISASRQFCKKPPAVMWPEWQRPARGR